MRLPLPACYFPLILVILLGEYTASAERPRATSTTYDRRRTSKKNQASPGIFFDPETGQFKRGNPPPDLVVKSQQLREEVKQTTNLQRELPFAKFTSGNNKDQYTHRLRERPAQSELDEISRQNAPGPQYSPEAASSELVYRHYKDPSE